MATHAASCCWCFRKRDPHLPLLLRLPVLQLFRPGRREPRSQPLDFSSPHRSYAPVDLCLRNDRLALFASAGPTTADPHDVLELGIFAGPSSPAASAATIPPSAAVVLRRWRFPILPTNPPPQPEENSKAGGGR